MITKWLCGVLRKHDWGYVIEVAEFGRVRYLHRRCRRCGKIETLNYTMFMPPPEHANCRCVVTPWL